MTKMDGICIFVMITNIYYYGTHGIGVKECLESREG